MEKNLLRQVQLAQLEILKEVKRVCQKNGIQYFLDSGTLLGAVRHKGFIPWDDDLDVGMLHSDYERFISIAPRELNNDFFLETWDTDSAYPFAFGKVMKKATKYVEDAFDGTNKHNELYIDIFPYYPYPNEPRERDIQARLIARYRNLEYMLSGMKPWVRHNNCVERFFVRLKYFPALIKARFLEKKDVNILYTNELKKFAGAVTDFFVPGGISKHVKWVIPVECFSDFIELPFEDDVFMCPKGYDVYLKHAYGDYMTLPPENQRENRHHIVEIKL